MFNIFNLFTKTQKTLPNSNLLLNYYSDLELFNIINEKSKLFFSLISDYYYTNFKIYKIEEYGTKQNTFSFRTPRLVSDYHIYVKELKIKNGFSNFNNMPALKSLIVDSGDYHGKILDLPQHLISNLKILKLWGVSSIKTDQIKQMDLLELSIFDDFSNYLNLSKFKNLRSLSIKHSYKGSKSNIKFKASNPNLVKLKLYGRIDWDKYDIKNYVTKNLKVLLIDADTFPDIHPNELNLVKLSLNKDNFDFRPTSIGPPTGNRVYHNPFKNNTNHMTNLRKLSLGECDDFTDNDIKDLNLIQLNLFQTNISNTYNTKSLKILDLTNIFMIDNEIMEKLNLVVLKIVDCRNINNINHMTNLKILIAPGIHFGFADHTIKYLNLVLLNINGNGSIKNINHMTKLKYLNISDTQVPNENITNLDLHILHAHNNDKIYDVSNMENLKVLYAGGSCMIDDAGIPYKNLVLLNSDDNNKIKNNKIKDTKLIKGVECERAMNTRYLIKYTPYNVSKSFYL